VDPSGPARLDAWITRCRLWFEEITLLYAALRGKLFKLSEKKKGPLMWRRAFYVRAVEPKAFIRGFADFGPHGLIKRPDAVFLRGDPVRGQRSSVDDVAMPRQFGL